jgi:uncharacterized repeat protein (TIGR01451 family)
MRLLATLLLALLAAPAAWAQSTTVYTVNTTADFPISTSAPLGDGICNDANNGEMGDQCSLRQAIAEANATSGDVIINLPGQLAGGNSGTYTLNEAAPNDASMTYEDDNEFGDLDIGGSGVAFSSLTIRGTGTPGPTVTQSVGGLGGDRLFHVLDGTTAEVRFERLNLTGGQARPGGNGEGTNTDTDGDGYSGVDGEDAPDGGAILIGMNATRVVIGQVTFSGNTTQSGGNGAVPSTSISRTEGGAAGDGGDGGALYISSGATVEIFRSTFSGNSTGDAGSAASGQSNNSANPARGGNGGDGGNGGGIYNAGTLTIQESTIADNTLGDPSQGASGVNNGANGFVGQGGSGGGIANAQRPETETLGATSAPDVVNEGTATLRNTIVASNTAGDDPTDTTPSDPDKQPGSDLFDATSGATFTTQGYNLIGTNNSVSATFPASSNETTYNANNDLVGTGQQSDASRINPDLGSLNQNQDEAVQTRPLLTASPAINRGVNTRIGGSDVPLDARGFLRPGTESGDATVDIGAYEFGSQDAAINLVINEFDAVTPGDNAEFVEIKNVGSFPAPLADVVLVLYDRDETACYSVNLRGELAAGDVYVIGDASISPDQRFDEGFAYEDCPPPSATNGDSDETSVDANVLDDQTGAVALYTGKATDYPNGAQAGQNMSTRQDVVVYDNSGSGGAPALAAMIRTQGAFARQMDSSSLCGSFGFGSDCAASGDTDDTSLSRDEDGGFSSGPPSPGQDNPGSAMGDRVCYAIANNSGDQATDDDFYRLDITSDGTVTQTLVNMGIGASGPDIEAVHFDPTSDRLFAVNSAGLATIDRNTGTYTLVGTFGSGEGEFGTLPFDDVDALAFDPTSGVLFVASKQASGPSVLFKLDPDTGELIENGFTVDRNSNGSFDDYVGVGPVSGAQTLDAILFDDNGQMVGILNDGASSGFVVDIDKETGATSNPRATTDSNIEGATFTTDGSALAVTGTGGTNPNSLLRLDTSTGTTSELTYADNGSELDGSDYEAIGCPQATSAPPTQQADLELTKTGPSTVPMPGDAVTFTLTLTNNGTGVTNPVTATDVELQDMLPAGFGYTGFSSDETTTTCSESSGTVTCQIPGIPDGGSVEILLETTAGSQGSFDNFAQVTASDQPDPDSTPGNDTDQVADEDDEAQTAGTVLPVELTAFDATLDGDRVRLSWTTASETNNSGFTLQRSTTADIWTDVGFVAGAGTTLETQRYSLTDIDAAFEAETLRYRLRQVDLDGSTAYSPVVEVTLGAPDEDAITGVYPMPVADRASVRVSLAREGNVRASLYDMLGREVAVLTDGFEPAGRMRLPLDASGLASGTYFVRVVTERGTLVEQITLAR